MKIPFLFISGILTLPLLAQAPAPPRPIAIRSGATQQSPGDPGENEDLGENVTIRLQGTVTKGSEIDLSLSGIGPKFTADQVIDDDTVLSCQYVVSETEAGYKVSYSVGARIKVVTQKSQNSTNFEYRDVVISGNVLCVAGKPTVLVRNGTKPLALTITKGAEKDAPDNGTTAPDSEKKDDVNPKPETEAGAH